MLTAIGYLITSPPRRISRLDSFTNYLHKLSLIPNVIMMQQSPIPRIARKNQNLSIQISKHLDITMGSRSPDFPPAPPPSPNQSLSLSNLSLGISVMDFEHSGTDSGYCTPQSDYCDRAEFPFVASLPTSQPSELKVPVSPIFPSAPPPSPVQKMHSFRTISWTEEEIAHLILACNSGVELVRF